MGPVSFSSMLANGCRSFGAPAALVRTLALTHVALSEHSNNYRHVKVAWFSRSSNKRKSAHFMERWSLCQLEVMECKEVPWPSSVVEQKYCVEDCGWPSKEYAYECKINLLTGRTHQVGDSMYMPAAVAEMASPGRNPFGKYKKHYTHVSDKEVAIEEWSAQHGKEPGVAIGLQACQISWDDGKYTFEAGAPWWRCQ